MPVGTRLGLLYSWKTKSIINIKRDAVNWFRREQAYNFTYKYIIPPIKVQETINYCQDNIVRRHSF